jgi:hypothetical protein
VCSPATEEHPTDVAIAPLGLRTAASGLNYQISQYYYINLTRSGHKLLRINPSGNYTDHP